MTEAESDYTGVDHSQLAVFRPSTAQWYVLGATGGQSLGTFGATNLTDVPAPGDYLAVGHTELAVFRPSTDQWFVQGPNGGVLLGVFGGQGDIPVPGDYDHIGRTEMAVFRPSTAQWFVFNPITKKGHQLLNPNNSTGAFGALNLTDVPVLGDYDGIGHTEMAVFRPSTAQWFVFDPVTGKGHQILNVNNATGAFGATNLTDIPVPGDYDGVGVTEMAVYRPSTGQWFVYDPVTWAVRTPDLQPQVIHRSIRRAGPRGHPGGGSGGEPRQARKALSESRMVSFLRANLQPKPPLRRLRPLI